MSDHAWSPLVRSVWVHRCVEVLDDGRWWPGWLYRWDLHEDGWWSAIPAWLGPGFTHRTAHRWQDELRAAEGWDAADVSAPGHTRIAFTAHPDWPAAYGRRDGLTPPGS